MTLYPITHYSIKCPFEDSDPEAYGNMRDHEMERLIEMALRWRHSASEPVPARKGQGTENPAGVRLLHSLVEGDTLSAQHIETIREYLRAGIACYRDDPAWQVEPYKGRNAEAITDLTNLLETLDLPQSKDG